MAAEYEPRTAPEPLSLLLEPLEPDPKVRKSTGWRARAGRDGWRIVRRWERNHADDERGALVQHVIVRYLVQGIQRQQLAAETGYSERQIQAYIGGRDYGSYGRAVLDALAELGITPRRGQRGGNGSGSTSTSPHRILELLAAHERLLDDAVRLLARSEAHGATELRTLARLLQAGREPLDGLAP